LHKDSFYTEHTSIVQAPYCAPMYKSHMTER